jgi:hypothetical protein
VSAPGLTGEKIHFDCDQTGRSRSCDSVIDFRPKFVIRNGSLARPASIAVFFQGPPRRQGHEAV